jgi:hypothetical protein
MCTPLWEVGAKERQVVPLSFAPASISQTPFADNGASDDQLYVRDCGRLYYRLCHRRHRWRRCFHGRPTPW